MPFVSNVPAAFQHYMNEIFADMLDVCVIVYLNDILIYSNNMSQHKAHIKEVLRKLWKNSLYASPPKCEWHKDEVEYLSYILTTEGLHIDQKKIQTCNFYRHSSLDTLILSFLSRCSPRKALLGTLTRNVALLLKNLKKEFTHALVLTHWVPDVQMIIKTNASDYTLSAIFSIFTSDGNIHPLAFHSCLFNSVELNYDTHDKELLS